MAYKRLERILIQLDAVDSTNNYAVGLLKSTKVSSGTTILTNKQQKGRGQRSNLWTTEDYKNLTFSTIFLSEIPAKRSFYLNVAVSLAVRKTLEDLKVESQIKWPNDILVNGKKICGILIENQISGDQIIGSALGVGLNVNQTVFDSPLSATSIKLEVSLEMVLMEVFDQLFSYLSFYLNLLSESQYDLLLKHYYEHLFQKDELHAYEDISGRFNGIIQGISEDGRLIVRRESENRLYDIKELTYF